MHSVEVISVIIVKPNKHGKLKEKDRQKLPSLIERKYFSH